MRLELAIPSGPPPLARRHNSLKAPSAPFRDWPGAGRFSACDRLAKLSAVLRATTDLPPSVPPTNGRTASRLGSMGPILKESQPPAPGRTRGPICFCGLANAHDTTRTSTTKHPRDRRPKPRPWLRPSKATPSPPTGAASSPAASSCCRPSSMASTSASSAGCRPCGASSR